MTPPGEPLDFNIGYALNRQFLKFEGDFPHLKEQVKEAIAHEAPHTVELLWKKKSRSGHFLWGAKVTVEIKNAAGKTAIFEAMFIKGNDKRSVINIKQGSYDTADATEFCSEYDGTLEPRRKGI